MKKINIAELLKDCPKGMELDCTIYENVTFERFDVEQNRCYFKAGPADTFWTTCYGKINGSPFGKCVIFPKGKTTWEGFHKPFEDGDIVAFDAHHLQIFIFKDKKENNTLSNCYLMLDVEDDELYLEDGMYYVTRFATEEEKQKLFDAIKLHGYKWNPETKTLEKLPKFKVGDKIKHKDSGIYCTLGEYSEGISAYRTNIGLSLTYKDMEQWELVPNKFDITTLKSFDKVLVRRNENNKWHCSFFSHMDEDLYYHCYKYVTITGKSYPMCIPYEGNEHLSGATNNCIEYYKTW